MSIQSEINRIAGAKSDIADAIEDKGVTVPSGTKLDGMANLIGQISGGSGKLNSTQAADAYDPTATYAVGDKVSYAGNVYSCISAISTPEAWDSTHWDQVDPIQDQVDDVRNTLNSKADAPIALSLTLASGSWSSAAPPTQTVSATGVTASNIVIIGFGSGITSAQYSAASAAKLACTAQGAGTITMTAFGAKPTENIPISVVVLS